MNGVSREVKNSFREYCSPTFLQKPDIYKGSYYANPLVDHPDVSEELRQKNWM